MDDKNNLLEKLGIVAKKEDAPKRKATSSPRPTTAKPADATALSNKYSSDDLAMEYEQMLKERAAMAKQIKDLEAKTATPAPKAATTYAAPLPVKTVAPKPAVEPPKAAAPATKPAPTSAKADTSYYYHDAENFTSVEDIYATQGKELNGVNTVYVVDSFVKTLPEALTDNVKRDVVLRILNVSNISADELIADGNARLNILSSYSNDFKEYTKEFISSRTQEVAILEDQIKNLKHEIMDRNKLQAKQQAEIAAETARISSNMVFITKDKAEASAE